MSIIDKIDNITEGTASSIDNDIKKLEKMTDRNMHTEAALYLAKNILKNKKYTKIMEGIKTILDAEGFTPSSLSDYKYSILLVLWKIAEEKFPLETSERIRQAF